MALANKLADRKWANRVTGRLVAFTLAGPVLMILGALFGLTGNALAALSATLPLGIVASLLFLGAHSWALDRQQRRALLDILGRSSRLHGLNKPQWTQLASGWFFGLLGAGNVMLATACLLRADSRPGLAVVAAMLGVAGLGLLCSAMRRVGDYQLQHDAWRESRVSHPGTGVRQ